METKKCIQCEETLPISHFEPRSHVNITKTTTVKYSYRRIKCRSCRAGRLLLSDQRHPNFIDLTDKVMDKDTTVPRNSKKRINRYGLTIADFNDLLKLQDYSCYICHYKFPEISKTNIDHCHKTNKVRGLLCWDCNTSLGRFKDNVDSLRRAAYYLENPPAFSITNREIVRITEPNIYVGTTLPVLYIKKEKPKRIPVYVKKPKRKFNLFNLKGQLVTTYYGIPDVIETLGVSRDSIKQILKGRQKFLKGMYTLKEDGLVYV